VANDIKVILLFNPSLIPLTKPTVAYQPDLKISIIFNKLSDFGDDGHKLIGTLKLRTAQALFRHAQSWATVPSVRQA
jgi:hypothetical protein